MVEWFHDDAPVRRVACPSVVVGASGRTTRGLLLAGHLLLVFPLPQPPALVGHPMAAQRMHALKRVSVAPGTAGRRGRPAEAGVAASATSRVGRGGGGFAVLRVLWQHEYETCVIRVKAFVYSSDVASTDSRAAKTTENMRDALVPAPGMVAASIRPCIVPAEQKEEVMVAETVTYNMYK